MPSPPDIELLLATWWGTGASLSSIAAITNAANIVTGGNPLYQISDFLAFYPKFGIGKQEMTGASVNSGVGAGGAGYAANDVLIPVQDGGEGAVITVLTVSGGGGVLTISVSAIGGGYREASALPTTTNGAGVGCLIDITAVSPTSLKANLPEAVLQAYINLAAASLSKNRWDATWEIGMAMFVAHYVTLYIRSEGTGGSTAGQIAASGLEKGILVSRGANSVNASSETVSNDLAGWGALRETTYGVQLATLAKTIGAGPMYIY